MQINAHLTCDDLLATTMQSYIDQSITAEIIIKTIKDQYNVSEKNIEVNMHEDGSWFIGWRRIGINYGIQSKGGKTISGIGMDYDDDSVTTKRIFDCISSPPEWYWAAYGPNPPRTGIRYAFNLYFPGAGIVATGTGSGRHQQLPPPLTSNSTISHLFIGAPGSLPALYQQRWGNALDDVRTNLRPVPWPGNWEAVRYIDDHGAGW